MAERRRRLRHVIGVEGWREVFRVRDVTLQQWALGSFHAALLLVGSLLALHLSDGLAGALEAGGTLVGGALYLVLLTSTVLTARLLATQVGFDERRGLRGTLRSVGWGALGGGVNGVLFLLGLLVVGFVGLLFVSPESLSVLLFVLVFGLLVAFSVGFVLGLAFALLDLLLFRAVVWLVPDDGRRERL